MFKGKGTSGGGNGEGREVPPAGNLPAVLIGMVDLGTRTETFQGESKKAHHILLVWELTGEPLSGTRDRNHVIGQRYTYSFHVKANIRQQYEKWDGRKYGENEEIDYAAKVAHPCLVSITHGQSGEGRTYAKVTGFGALPKEMVPHVKPPKHQPFLYSLAEGLYLRDPKTRKMEQAGSDLPEWEWLPFVYGVSVQETIEDSDEWKALMRPAHAATAPAQPPAEQPHPAMPPGTEPVAADGPIPW